MRVGGGQAVIRGVGPTWKEGNTRKKEESTITERSQKSRKDVLEKGSKERPMPRKDSEKKKK